MNEKDFKKFEEVVIIMGFVGVIFLAIFMIAMTILTFKGEYPLFLFVLLWSVVIYAGHGICKIIRRDGGVK